MKRKGRTMFSVDPKERYYDGRKVQDVSVSPNGMKITNTDGSITNNKYHGDLLSILNKKPSAGGMNHMLKKRLRSKK